MSLRTLLIAATFLFSAPCLLTSQYVYFPNDLGLIEELGVKKERIKYSERTGDTSIFETNVYDIKGNLVEYKSKENMPIQAKVVYHYDDENNCTQVDYYRNHIFYQYKEIKRTKLRNTERYYSVTGKYKGLEQATSFDDEGREEKIVIKRKGHPKLTKKFLYHENGKLKEIRVKKDRKVSIRKYDLNGDPILKEEKIETPREITERYANEAIKVEKRSYVVTDILPEEIMKVGSGHKDKYKMEMFTHYLPNGLNERTEIYIEDKLMYVYMFNYTFHGEKDQGQETITSVELR